MLSKILEGIPLIAILRGIKPEEAEAIGKVLYARGLRCIEVPLNSPKPFDSIKILADTLPDDCLVGAGTVVFPEDVQKVYDAGGRIIVTPNTNADVIKAALALNMDVTPGIATITDAFTAVHAGATHLKIFPASTYGVGHVKAISAVLPPETKLLAVGGVGASNMAEWTQAGCVGFGIASELYKAGDSAEAVDAKAAKLVAAL
ncbi:2-dehydro-3-deoxy-6-phosphogalactonate aldolase [Hirschia litorea]|uniref:2-dehydro-3-deoxy-6-phosphogalactonate aldolase n=1 Tax=Hirschia litorea TaxID=1199156 RepID=A0ABW2INS3_9PROT